MSRQAELNSIANKIRQTHSAYWMGSSADELAEKVEEGSIEYLDRLRRIQRATANFVNIVTGRDIPVVYSSGQQSYTTGKQVVLSADTDPLKLDSLVGTALHEGAHCLLSNRSLAFLPLMHNEFEKLVRGRPILASSFKLGLNVTKSAIGANLGQKGETVMDHVQMVMNVLEDRRIDLWMYKNAPGYRPYYDSLYNTYWHSDTVDKMMQDPRAWDRSVEAYFMFIINITNKHYNEQAMPGLAEIKKIANLTDAGVSARGDEDEGWHTWVGAVKANTPTVNFDRVPKLFADAVKIVEIVYENATKLEADFKPNSKGPGDMQPGDLPNMDNASGTRPATQAEIDALRKALDRQKKFLDGDIEKKEIDARDATQLDNMQQSNAMITSVEGDFLPRGVKAKVIIYRNITKEIAKSAAFPFSVNASSRYYGSSTSRGTNSMMEKALSDGIKMGNVLAHRIRVMQDERPLTFNRQEHGRLDKRRVSALGLGSDDVFQFTITEKKKPANLWMDIDFSGSMAGVKVQQAMTVAVAIAKAAELTRTLNCTIAIRDGDDAVRIAILYDSRKHSFNQLRAIVPYLTAAGGTPESLAFEAVKEEMLKMYGGERKYFINLSDGEPAHAFTFRGQSYNYGYAASYSHTRRLMKEFRAAGIHILSYYIGNGSTHDGFRQMYGHDAVFIDPSQISGIVRTLNKLLMKEE